MRYQRSTMILGGDLQVGDIVYNDQDGYVNVVEIHEIVDPSGNNNTMMWESSTGRFFPFIPDAPIRLMYKPAGR